MQSFKWSKIIAKKGEVMFDEGHFLVGGWWLPRTQQPFGHKFNLWSSTATYTHPHTHIYWELWHSNDFTATWSGWFITTLKFICFLFWLPCSSGRLALLLNRYAVRYGFGLRKCTTTICGTVGRVLVVAVNTVLSYRQNRSIHLKGIWTI